MSNDQQEGLETADTTGQPWDTIRPEDDLVPEVIFPREKLRWGTTPILAAQEVPDVAEGDEDFGLRPEERAGLRTEKSAEDLGLRTESGGSGSQQSEVRIQTSSANHTAGQSAGSDSDPSAAPRPAINSSAQNEQIRVVATISADPLSPQSSVLSPTTPLSYESPRSSTYIPQTVGGWTIAVLCMGLGLICACVVIPQADANRQLVYERAKLRADLEQIDRQTAVNAEFLKRVETDPQLAERLAQRQMNVIRAGTSVLDVKHDGKDEVSPFLLVNVPPPAAVPAYTPIGGIFANLCRNPRSQLYMLGFGLLMVAVGLVLGYTPAKKPE